MKKLVFFFFLFIILTSCNKDDYCDCKTHYSTAFRMAFVDSSGHDLLDSTYVNSYDLDSIQEFYFKSEDAEPTKRHFKPLIFKDFKTRQNIVQIECNTDETKEKPITYLKLSATDTDTITATFNRNNGIKIDSLWYNGKKITGNPENSYGTVIKAQ